MKKRTKQKKHNKQNGGKKVSALKLLRELFVWHREFAGFRNNVLIKRN